jgi:hypothetical protein
MARETEVNLIQHGGSFIRWLLDRVVGWIIIPLAGSSRLVSLFFFSFLGVLHTLFCVWHLACIHPVVMHAAVVLIEIPYTT